MHIKIRDLKKLENKYIALQQQYASLQRDYHVVQDSHQALTETLARVRKEGVANDSALAEMERRLRLAEARADAGNYCTKKQGQEEGA